MDILGNCKIKRETLITVLRYLFSEPGTTRRSVSEACGISLATSGKAVDYFVGAGLFTEKRSFEQNGGPRPMVININRKYNCVLLDLYSPEHRLFLYDIYGSVIESGEYPMNGDIFPDDSLARALRDFNEKCRYHKSEYRFGCGAMMPDDYFIWRDMHYTGNRDLYASSVEAIVSKTLHTPRFDAVSKEELAARYFASIPEYADKTVVYVCLNKNDIISAAVWNGHLIRGRKSVGLDVGNIFVSKYRTLGDDLINEYDPDKTAKLCAEMCVNLIPYYDPHVIYFDSEDYLSIGGICPMILASIRRDFGIEGDLPEIIGPERGREPVFRRAMVGHMKELFRLDIESKIRESE